MFSNLKKSVQNVTTVRGIALSGMFIALYVALGAVKFYITPDNRISMTFIALMGAGYFLGGIPAMIIGAAADIINFVLFPSGGAYFPGYTISAAVSGLLYGSFLYGYSGKRLIINLVISKLLITLVVSLGLNTYWSSLFSPRGFYVILIGKLVKTAITLPIQFVSGLMLVSVFERAGLRRKYINKIS